MNAVMYGGGNIGRGFIGALLSQSGYRVTFIDVAPLVVEHLQQKGCYPIRYVFSGGHEDVLVENVTAVNGNDPEVTSDVIANCDIMATAVGARVLKCIIPNIVAGLRKRWSAGGKPLNIIICENLMDVNLVIEGMIKEQLTEEEKAAFDQTIGLVEASVGRMVPVQTEEMKDGEPMRVCVECYGFLPTDGTAFKGGIPEIKNMVPFAPFDFYLKRKLYIHNMGHATCAYLGDLLGVQYIHEAIDVADIRILVQNAMIESALALSGKYDVALGDVMMHITDLLHRFTNAALGDTTARVGGDPARKLSPNDRMIGSSLLALEQGVTPAYIAVGAAAGLHRYIKEAEMGQGIASAVKVLAEVSKLDSAHDPAKLILAMYEKILSGATTADLRRAADALKAATMKAVI